ncbi:hypothetical protein G3A_02270 [Bacillus sp. 17376]|uniref:Uncharacterized protein n=1 Tax=Mesobacillus boroniphilus JCM 21738 TaxID=1294265 RepID=W4RI27_9BACI|nr:hypothetical protein [Mesobacillus boroniphilus]ESU34202.1 hypothetical protein G3A_02270 [Bacillus sp. 17376]GAE44100.1 hypothetical protein JCM21738_782 [Mesobacillus boroniphilus JCM 21738]
MTKSNELSKIIEELRDNPPKIIGGYKKQGWATKVLDKISNDAITVEEDRTVTAMAIIKSKDNSFYPAFLHLDQQKGGQILGVYFIAEKEEQFDLFPFEVAREFLNKPEEDLLPLQYRTLEKIEGDQYQKNWPDFS